MGFLRLDSTGTFMENMKICLDAIEDIPWAQSPAEVGNVDQLEDLSEAELLATVEGLDAKVAQQAHLQSQLPAAPEPIVAIAPDDEEQELEDEPAEEDPEAELPIGFGVAVRDDYQLECICNGQGIAKILKELGRM